MEIFFHTRKLQKICSEEKEMKKVLGLRMAGKLKQRMTELKAADVLADISHLPPPRCHELTDNRAGQLSVDLRHPYRLIFIPADDPIPTLKDGGLEKSAITSIEIIEIVDTH